MRLLITAFEPFGNCDINPSYELLKRLPDSMGEATIEKQLLPVSFNNSFAILENRIKNTEYDVIIMLGQYGGSEHIRLEMAGHNIISTKKPDNDGNIPLPKPIANNAGYGYFTSFDLWHIADKLKSKGCMVEISESAGGYVCNFIYFSCLHYIKEHDLSTKALFVHLPFIKEQQKEPSLTLDEEYKTIITLLNIIREGEK